MRAAISKSFLASIGLTALFATVALPSAAADLPAAHHVGRSTYVTGGIGLDESTAFKSAMKDWPMSLMFVQKDGDRAEYVADVKVKVIEHSGAMAFTTDSQGPFMLANLQPGAYKVEATFDNKTLQQNVEVKQGKPVKLTFLWTP